MGKKEALQKEIEQIADRVKFLRNAFLAIISGFVWLGFSIGIGKINVNFISLSFLIAGGISIVVIAILIALEETKRDKKIKELENIE